MEYISYKRFKKNCICGYVNIPALTKCTSISHVITYNGKPVCFDTSEDAYQYFARNDDGHGIARGNLTSSIQRKLENRRDPLYQTRWDSIWNDLICQKYKRPEYENYWLWNDDFFNAPVEDLQYIARLIGIREEHNATES